MKFVLLSFILLSIVNANILQDKIKNIIGTQNYIKNKNLIQHITQNKDLFYIGDNLKYTKILNLLHENGLLNLRFNKPQQVTLTFTVDKNPVLALKIIKDTLSNLGYSYYFTDLLSSNDNAISWKISFKSESMMDPYIFNKELQRSESFILNITKISSRSWKYKIDVNNGRIAEANKIEKNEKIRLLKPLKPYLLKVDNALELIIISHKLNHWFPNISFYSKDLKVIGEVRKSRVYRGVKIKLLKGTYYIKIDDAYTLLNIKRGLTIIVK